MRNLSYLAAAILLAAAPAVLADSVQFTINSSVLVSGSSPNDNYWGEYRTAPDATGTQSQVSANVPFATANATLSNMSFFLPAGSIVTSATMNLILPIDPITGTGSVSIAPETLPPPDLDPSGVHIAPTFNNPATSTFSVQDVFLQPAGTSFMYEGNFFPNKPIIVGDELSTGTWYLNFLLIGQITGTVNTPGYNWDGYIEGDGQATLPYSVQIDVDYTIAPEPPTFVLLATATVIVGLFIVARRKRLTS